MNNTNTPIAAIEAEQYILGGLLIDNEAFDRMGYLEARHFFIADNRAIFDQIKKLLEAGEAADVLTVFDALQAAGHDIGLVYLNDLAANTLSTANIAIYCNMVREKAQLRGLVNVAGEIKEKAGAAGAKVTSIVEQAQNEIEKLAETRESTEPTSISEDLGAYLDELDKRYHGDMPTAISTGYPDLDKLLNGGFRGGQLGLIAGRPKMGKTALALEICGNTAEAENTTAFLSMEMPKKELMDRRIASAGRISLNKLLNPKEMNDSDWPSITHAVQKIKDWPLYTDDQGGLRLADVRQKARSLKRKHGLKVLAIDYLQLMEGDGDTRNAQIEQITRGLKTLAKELDITILLLSQLNRQLEQRPNKRPMPSDLRDSGAIEQDCDFALFVYRDEVYNPDSPDKGICEVIVGLNRQGALGTAGLAYIGEQTRFESLAAGTQFGRGPAPSSRAKRGGLMD